MDRPGQYFHTLKYLKARQIVFRAHYFLRSRLRRMNGHTPTWFIPKRSQKLGLQPSIPRIRSYGERHFSFLNQTTRFDGAVDWNYSGFGKLWAYNLNYFDFLNQGGVDARTGLGLIEDFISQVKRNTVGLEPYPVCLRIINWIKFLSRHGIRDPKIDGNLYAQARNLSHHLEFHLLGNHLLENGFALLFAAFYFHDRKLYRVALRILTAELDEQILTDGGHFELSPMYHQIILDRVLDCINLIDNNSQVYRILSQNGSAPAVNPKSRNHNSINSFRPSEKSLLPMLRHRAASMLGWLNEVTFLNGDIPLVNDAAFGIAPITGQLQDFAMRLGIRKRVVRSGESGYRTIAGKNHEILIDIGRIGPDYIPGHAHADTFNFLLNVGDSPVIVDTGTSTYENNELRHRQRSTRAHNTVEIDGQDQSEMWGCFRVARRARVTQRQESKTCIAAAHDGYRRLAGKPVHRRQWHFQEQGVEIRDRIDGRFREAVSRFHFHPAVQIQTAAPDADVGKIRLQNGAIVSWRIDNGCGRLTESTYHPEFNQSLPNRCLEVRFAESETSIKFAW